MYHDDTFVPVVPLFFSSLFDCFVSSGSGEAERSHSLLRAVGAPVTACNPVPPVVQACQACRPWMRAGQSNKFTFSFALLFKDGVRFDLMFFQVCVPTSFRREMLHIHCTVDMLLRYVVCMCNVSIA